MFRARTWSALLLVSAMVFLMGARQVPLTDPQPIAVPAGLKVEQVSKAIRAAHDPSQLPELDSESRERHESQPRARPVVR